ncbi:hypothetical protein V8J82_16660 [Gymnodinialimonas sp. 2305UL16-5]|uniref:hypothetical protein n=1 Tax=Gymnodinialimonas mytili TaxID=3126503 RepID=UPI0030A35D7E
MSDTDSFIDEVSEELRRDRLYSLFRKWGWIPILLVIAIVGGAAYFEWQRAQAEQRAQAFGDALLTALDAEDPATRIGALETVATPNAQTRMIIALMASAEAASADQAPEAAARLREAAQAPDLNRLYTDLALLKAEMLDPGTEAESRQVLERIAAPGAPYAPLAEEQLALLEVRSGDLEAALDRLRAIERSAAASPGLQQRASQLIVALSSGAVLVDEGPAPVAEETEVAPQDEAPAEETEAEQVPDTEGDAAPEAAEDPADAAPETRAEPEGAEEDPAPETDEDGAASEPASE